MTKKLLISGASGGLGSHLVERARRSDWQVAALIRPETDRNSLSSLSIQETMSWDDLRPDALAPFHTIVHLAAYVHQNSRQPNYEENHRRANHQLPVELARAAVEAKVPHLVFASSIAVYGRFRTGRVDETTAPAPTDAYGAAKRAAEIDLTALVQGSSTQLTILRLPMVYGPGVKGNLLPLLRMAARRRKLPLGGARGKRSFLYAGNFADAVCHLLDHPTTPAETLIYFLADGEDLTSRGLYDFIFGALNEVPGTYSFPVELLRLGGAIGSLVERVSGRSIPLTTATVHRLFEELRVDGEPFRRDLAWKPPFSPEEGLRLTADWFRGVLENS